MGYDTLMDEEDQMSPKLHAVFIIFALSIAEIAATADLCYVQEHVCQSEIGAEFALVVGLVSFAFCIALLGMYYSIGTHFKQMEVLCSIFLAFGWGVGMVANTSPSGPFNRADNGYFATWGCMLSSWYYMYLCVQRLQTVLDREVVQHNSSLAIVFVTSLFEFAYAAKDCNANGTCTEERAFAVAVGVISFFFCLFQLMFVRLGAPAGIVCAKPIGLILVILWSAGLGSNTSSNGPFQSPCEHANGFFASWLCWGFSVQYCYNSVFGPPPGRVSRYMYGDDDDSMLHQDEPGAYGSIGPGVE
eukprot:m.28463 g.28463  ORF g.28463 m.28463 type:complete len:302 (-) comp6554_c0_seq1:979-1884(-)